MVTILVSVEAFCSSASGGSRAPVTEVSPNRQTVWIIEFGRKFQGFHIGSQNQETSVEHHDSSSYVRQGTKVTMGGHSC